MKKDRTYKIAEYIKVIVEACNSIHAGMSRRELQKLSKVLRNNGWNVWYGAL